MNSEKLQVVSVNISRETGTSKQPASQILIDENGVAGDAHAGQWHRQVSLLAQESIDRFVAETGRQVSPGDFAENITTRGADLGNVAILDRFQIGSVELEVTQIGKACHGEGCAIYQQVGRCVMPEQGIFCRVIKGGTIKPGDTIMYVPKALRIMIITLSDRAARGEYEDRSGPQVRSILEQFFEDKRWHTDIETVVLPDDAAQLKTQLQTAHDADTDVIFTTGGTGVGPRDITPDVVTSLTDKTIPGIMEHIRVKFGRDKPNALLSRSVAAAWDQTLIYTLPGSVKAVQEYMSEILKTLEHLLVTLRGWDVH